MVTSKANDLHAWTPHSHKQQQPHRSLIRSILPRSHTTTREAPFDTNLSHSARFKRAGNVLWYSSIRLFDLTLPEAPAAPIHPLQILTDRHASQQLVVQRPYGPDKMVVALYLELLHSKLARRRSASTHWKRGALLLVRSCCSSVSCGRDTKECMQRPQGARQHQSRHQSRLWRRWRGRWYRRYSNKCRMWV